MAGRPASPVRRGDIRDACCPGSRAEDQMSDGAIPQDQTPPYRRSADEVVAALGTDARRGLGREEARRRLERHGRNELSAEKPVPAWRKFLAQFQDVLVILLLAAALVSAGLWLLERDTRAALRGPGDPRRRAAQRADGLRPAGAGGAGRRGAAPDVGGARQRRPRRRAAEHPRGRGGAGRRHRDRGGRHHPRRRAGDPVHRAPGGGGGAHGREPAGARRTPPRWRRRSGSATAATWSSAARRRPTGTAGRWSRPPGCRPRWGASPAC